MLPVVVIDVVPADVPAEHSQAMVDACSAALPSGDCALSSSTKESTRPEAVALVVFQDGDFLRVTVRVGRRDREWVNRQLSFSNEDVLSERWTTIGLTVATLVDEIQPSPPVPSDAASQPLPTTPANDSGQAKPPAKAVTQSSKGVQAKASSPSPASAPLEFRVSVGGLIAPGWDDGDMQRGAWADFALRLPKSILFAAAYGSYAISDGPAAFNGKLWSTQWVTGAVGAGVETELVPIELRLRVLAEISYRMAIAEVENVKGVATSSEFRARVRGGAAWPSTGRFAGLVGGAFGIPPVPLDGAESDERHARGPNLMAELLVGVEARF